MSTGSGDLFALLEGQRRCENCRGRRNDGGDECPACGSERKSGAGTTISTAPPAVEGEGGGGTEAAAPAPAPAPAPAAAIGIGAGGCSFRLPPAPANGPGGFTFGSTEPAPAAAATADTADTADAPAPVPGPAPAGGATSSGWLEMPAGRKKKVISSARMRRGYDNRGSQDRRYRDYKAAKGESSLEFSEWKVQVDDGPTTSKSVAFGRILFGIHPDAAFFGYEGDAPPVGPRRDDDEARAAYNQYIREWPESHDRRRQQ